MGINIIRGQTRPFRTRRVPLYRQPTTTTTHTLSWLYHHNNNNSNQEQDYQQ